MLSSAPTAAAKEVANGECWFSHDRRWVAESSPETRCEHVCLRLRSSSHRFGIELIRHDRRSPSLPMRTANVLLECLPPFRLLARFFRDRVVSSAAVRVRIQHVSSHARPQLRRQCRRAHRTHARHRMDTLTGLNVTAAKRQIGHGRSGYSLQRRGGLNLVALRLRFWRVPINRCCEFHDG